MEHRTTTLTELEEKAPLATSTHALVGVDGFVDKIVHAVDKRSGPGDQFERIPTIADFGGRISSAAGKSANIELAPVVDKLGGNGPIMAHAQGALGLSVSYIGALGKATIHPTFTEFASRNRTISLVDPGITHAAEFSDGKIMFGSMASLDEITYDLMVEKAGGEAALVQFFAEADSISMVNWTMVPFLTDVFRDFISKLLPRMPENAKRIFFFDLADPEKRSDADLLEVLEMLQSFEAFGKVVLGLNYRESEQVDKLLGFTPLEKSPENLQTVASRIRQRLAINSVVIHPVECAACATPEGTAFVTGPLCDNPKITTGAGDHFNAGFLSARLIGLSPEAALTVAVATSGYYVRTATSPSFANLAEFIGTWS